MPKVSPSGGGLGYEFSADLGSSARVALHHHCWTAFGSDLLRQ